MFDRHSVLVRMSGPFDPVEMGRLAEEMHEFAPRVVAQGESEWTCELAVPAVDEYRSCLIAMSLLYSRGLQFDWARPADWAPSAP